MDPSAERHEKLTIHAVHHTSMTWYERRKVFDSICAFDSGSQESTTGCDNGSKQSQPYPVDLNRIDGQGQLKM